MIATMIAAIVAIVRMTVGAPAAPAVAAEKTPGRGKQSDGAKQKKENFHRPNAASG